MIQNETKRGIWLMVVTTFIFASQDGLSRHLAEAANTPMIVMIRYWFFALFVISIARRQKGSIRAAAATSQPLVQAFRGALLALEIMVMVLAFVYLGLVESHAVFAVYPLLIGALSGPVLGEKVGWRRWTAIAVGFVGVIIILQPGSSVFSPYAAIPFLAALMFAVYGLLNRYVARLDDTATSFFWTGVVGAIVSTAIGVFYWEPLQGWDWALMLLLCITGAAGHYTMIKAYEVAEASAIQPFAYLQLVFASAIGLTIFGETLRINVIVGAGLIIAAGLFTFWRERVRRKQN
ncbi:DMT family transporter [Sneathiella glossodoripedis]|uniref:DMT family transporter n=1 Tax=Sneathiella glossodoripedis TaxID=418853 RepID=UPI00046E7EFA|nr:DMT family transporter [Sneathiella glossodoripedis]